MSAIDQFCEMQRIKAEIEAVTFSFSGPPNVRVWYRNDSETSLGAEATKALSDGASYSVRQHAGSGFDYQGSLAIGAAIKAAALRYLDDQLKALASAAEQEARDVLAIVGAAKEGGRQ